MLFKLSRITHAESEKDEFKLARYENHNLTMPVIKFEERTWLVA